MLIFRTRKNLIDPITCLDSKLLLKLYQIRFSTIIMNWCKPTFLFTKVKVFTFPKLSYKNFNFMQFWCYKDSKNWVKKIKFSKIIRQHEKFLINYENSPQLTLPTPVSIFLSFPLKSRLESFLFKVFKWEWTNVGDENE